MNRQSWPPAWPSTPEEREALAEIAAAERIAELMDFENQPWLCRYCQADNHTDAACPVKAEQERVEARRRAAWRERR